MPNDSGDINATAREWYVAKLANGQTPEVYQGGELDGLRYFEITLDGVSYWLTDVGLFDPPASLISRPEDAARNSHD